MTRLSRLALMGGAAAAAATTVVLVTMRGGEREFTPLSLAELREIFPGASAAVAAEHLPHLTRAMAQANISTVQRAAFYLAQLGHESGGLRYMEELASGTAYEGREDLGNTVKGDGVRFKGRGPIQLTGRANYQRAGLALGLDLVANPAQVASPAVGHLVAAWYWRDRGLNELADTGDFVAVTKRVNGGTNGLASRQEYLARAQAVLGRRAA